MQEENQTKTLPPLRDKALAYLARREQTRLELARKLMHAGYPEDEISVLLDDLEARGWLSSRRFAENYVEQKQSRFGNVKLAHELRQRGVDESEVQHALAESKETELERARAVWQKKFGRPPANAAEKAKHIRFMQGRGFPLDVTLRLLATLYGTSLQEATSPRIE